MIRRTAWSAPLVLLAAACGPGPQPATAPVMGPPGTLESPPIYALLGDRQTLDLESEQISALDSIGGWLSAENAPRLRRLQELRGGYRGPGGAQAVPATEEARTLAEQIRQANQAAAEGVRQVLSEEQQARTCELFRDTDRQRLRRAESRSRDLRSPPTGRPGRRAEPRPVAPPVWFWCVDEAGPTSEG